MRAWLAMGLAIVLCLCMTACTNASDGDAADEEGATTTQAADLPNGGTGNGGKQVVIELTPENWADYFYFSATIEPSAWDGGDKIADFMAFPVICLKDEYRQRVVSCQYDIELEQENLTAYAVEYHTDTKLTVAHRCTEAEWEAWNVSLPHTEAWGGQPSVYTFTTAYVAHASGGMVMSDDPEPGQFHRATVSEDGKVYTVPCRVPDQFFIRSVMGTLTLSE